MFNVQFLIKNPMRFTFAKDLHSTLLIDIGRDTPFHKSMYWISITREYTNSSGEIVHADWIKGFFLKRKLK
jgi:hypothetical protein